MPGAKNYDGYIGQKFGLLTLEEVLYEDAQIYFTCKMDITKQLF